MYKVLKRLECYGLLDTMFSRGVIPCSIKSHKNIYEAYLKEKEKGRGTSDAVLEISVEFDVSQKTIYSIIRKMKS